MTNPQDAIRNLTNCINEISLDQFKIFTESDEPAQTEIEIDRLPFAQFLAQILIFGSDLSVTIKCHFMLESAHHLCQWALRRKEVSDAEAIDFVKEYCNLIAGKTKSLFEDHQIFLGQSLPFVTHGYNELFYTHTCQLFALRAWTLKRGHVGVNFSVTVDVFDAKILPIVNSIKYLAEFGREIDGMEVL